MPTRMFRNARIGRMTTGAAIAVLLLGACVSQDVDGDDLADALEEAGASRAQARCAAERFDDELDQDERNEVASATDDEEIDDLDDTVRETYESIMAECVGGQEPTTTAEEGTDPETSETTTAGEEPTTTAAE